MNELFIFIHLYLLHVNFFYLYSFFKLLSCSVVASVIGLYKMLFERNTQIATLTETFTDGYINEDNSIAICLSNCL